MFGRKWLYNAVLRDFKIGIWIYFLRFYFDGNGADLALKWNLSEFGGRNKKGVLRGNKVRRGEWSERDFGCYF